MKLKHELWKAMNPSPDSIAIYPLCLNCFCKATYLPKYEETAKVVNLFAWKGQNNNLKVYKRPSCSFKAVIFALENIQCEWH